MAPHVDRVAVGPQGVRAQTHSFQGTAWRVNRVVDDECPGCALSNSYLMGSLPTGTSMITLRSFGRAIANGDGIKTHDDLSCSMGMTPTPAS